MNCVFNPPSSRKPVNLTPKEAFDILCRSCRVVDRADGYVTFALLKDPIYPADFVTVPDLSDEGAK